MVSTIPAIPGKVKTAPKASRIPKMKNILTIRAKLAPNPAPL